jgi:hypothetical protein
MTVKNVWVKDNYGKSLGYAYIKETPGGQEIDIQLNHELSELTKWWREWGPVFSNSNPTVTDALHQAKVLHDVTQA